MRSRELSSESAEAQSLLKQLAGTLRDDWPRSFGGLGCFGGALCILTALSFSTSPATWDRQESVNVATAVYSEACDLPAGIDPMCEQQVQRGTGSEGIEVNHSPVVAEERAYVIKACVTRHANHFAAVVNAKTAAIDVTGNRTQVPNARLLGPQEPVKGCVTGQIRSTNHLTLVVDLSRDIARSERSRATEIAEVNCRAFVPEQGVARQDVHAGIGVE